MNFEVFNFLFDRLVREEDEGEYLGLFNYTLDNIAVLINSLVIVICTDSEDAKLPEHGNEKVRKLLKFFDGSISPS